MLDIDYVLLVHVHVISDLIVYGFAVALMKPLWLNFLQLCNTF